MAKQVSHENDHPTAQSIEQAKRDQLAARADVERQTGVKITDEGRPQAWLIACTRKGCKYVASARNEGRAINALGSHLVQVHFPEALRRDH